MTCFLVLFHKGQRPPKPEKLDRIIELGDSAYITASKELTTEEITDAFGIGERCVGIVVRMDSFRGWANADVVDKLTVWQQQ